MLDLDAIEEADLLARFDLYRVRQEISGHLPEVREPRDDGPCRTRQEPPYYRWRRALGSWLGAKKSPVPSDLKHLNHLAHSAPQDWRWLRPQPTDWGLKARLGGEIEVEFYTYSRLYPERIFHHLDRFQPGDYRPDSKHKVVGEGPEGVDM